MMAKSKFLIRDPDGLNLLFYQSYDEGFLLRKADTLLFIAEHSGEFREFIAKNGGDPEAVDKKYLETLRAEVHFAEFHQFEAFFALLIAIFQDLPHWLYLTTYPVGEIRQRVKAYLERDVSTLTNGLLSTLDDFLNWAIYAGFLSTEKDKIENWQANLHNIDWLLTRIGRKYLEGSEYNAYKHGLRVMTGPSYFRFRPSGSPTGGISFTSDDSLKFLEIEASEEGNRIVRKTFKHFNPEESIHHLSFMCDILEMVKVVRLARLRGEDSAELKTFFGLKKEDISKLMTRTKWSISV